MLDISCHWCVVQKWTMRQCLGYKNVNNRPSTFYFVERFFVVAFSVFSFFIFFFAIGGLVLYVYHPQNVIILSVITLFIIPKYLRHSLYFGLFWACHLIESNAMEHTNFNCPVSYTLHIAYIVSYREYTLYTFRCELLGHVPLLLPRSFRIMKMQEEARKESIKLNDNNCNV